MAATKPELTASDVAVNKIVGRTITEFWFDDDGLNLSLNDGQIVVFCGVLCLVPAENGSH